MGRCVYHGTTLTEAQRLVAGDFATFNGKVYLKLNQAVSMAERALLNEDDKPAIVELLVKSEEMLIGNDIKQIDAIKSARLISAEELLRRTGYAFDRNDVSGLPLGVVIQSSHGVYTVQCENSNSIYQCSLRGKRTLNSFMMSGGVQPIAVGDHVRVRVIDAKTGVIEAIMGRTSQYGRKRAKKSSHIIVANLDGLIIVSAAKQPPIWQRMLDTFLVIAEAHNIHPLICINKIDLVEDRQSILSLLSVYEKIGYATIITSAMTGEGIEGLRQWIKGKISAVAGLSGVGKSALLNAIQPGLQLKTTEVHEKRGGRHTTSEVKLLKLDFGGFVADTPGIRSLSLSEVETHKMDSYFPEMRLLRDKCERNPCTHLQEADCAVKAAVKDRHIAKERYQSYCELRKVKGDV